MLFLTSACRCLGFQVEGQKMNFMFTIPEINKEKNNKTTPGALPGQEDSGIHLSPPLQVWDYECRYA
jgi:hypothetical protein